MGEECCKLCADNRAVRVNDIVSCCADSSCLLDPGIHVSENDAEDSTVWVLMKRCVGEQCCNCVQTIALCGTSLFLILISYTDSYYGSLTCMAIAVACCGFHNSGILVNPQDIAPRHAGSVFGEGL